MTLLDVGGGLHDGVRKKRKISQDKSFGLGIRIAYFLDNKAPLQIAYGMLPFLTFFLVCGILRKILGPSSPTSHNVEVILKVELGLVTSNNTDH